MYFPDQLIQVGSEGCTTGYYDDSGCPKYSDHELMQFTGLLDKNGKEIYEGDIVICINGHEGVVEWEKSDCCFNVTGYYNASNDYPSMAFMEGQPFEVIGNIYENPELLEDMK
jgi:uncharacterized phage protein (TIGR01671 family)